MNERTEWNIKDKVCMITGANTGLGKNTAVELAKMGAHVFLACRSIDRTLPVINEIQTLAGPGNADYLPLNLASFASIRNCVSMFMSTGLPLHVLINNAGIAGYGGSTEDGFDMEIGVNYLGHYLLTRLLIEKLRTSAPARIINITSYSHRRIKSIQWNLIQNPTPEFIWLNRTYPLSKFFNILFTRELAKKLHGSRVTTYAVHPGFVSTDIFRPAPLPIRLLLRAILPSSKQGAKTQIYCATEPTISQESGQFYAGCKRGHPSTLSQNAQLAEELWQRSETWCNLTSK
ncbi:MAG: SDR family oxidoreductase [Desulfatirhabdiaceae bacterium]